MAAWFAALAADSGVKARAAKDLQRPSSPPGIKITRQVTEADAAAIALWNNSQLHTGLASLGLAEADVLDASLLRNFNLQALLPVAGKPFEFLIQAPIEAAIQRPKRLDLARANLKQTSQAVVQFGLDTARNARLAWAELELAGRREAATKRALELRKQIVELTERRLRGGDISEFDTNLTRVDLRSLEEQHARIAADIEIARERFRMALGLRGTQERFEAAAAPADPVPLDSLDPLLERAFAARPDLRAAESGVEVALKRAKWERSRVLALLGPMLSIKGSGSPTKIRTGPGILADLPLFNRNQGLIKRADAEVERSTLQYLVVKDQVEFEVREAAAIRAQASDSLRMIRAELLPGVRKNIRLATIAYRDGDASYLNVLEANRQIYDIELREADAIAALRRATANLERAIGAKP